MLHKRSVVRKPILTEKVAALQDKNNQYAFVVDGVANKIEIKRAIELKYSGKVKRMGRFVGKRADWKKAIVTLKEGDRIELAQNV